MISPKKYIISADNNNKIKNKIIFGSTVKFVSYPIQYSDSIPTIFFSKSVFVNRSCCCSPNDFLSSEY